MIARALRHKLIGTVLVLSAAVAHHTPAQQIGRIVYLEGDVEIVRDGQVRGPVDLDIGTDIVNFDVIQTGFDGYAEIELNLPAAVMIRVRENSAYYVEQDPAGEADSTVRLLSGRVNLDVQSMQQGSRLRVETQSAVIGVRGTQFDVITSPDEATLVGVREGSVGIETGGRRLTADSGSAVEALPNAAPSRIQVAGDEFDRVYERWTEARLRIFRSGASTFIRAYARRFMDTEPTFQDAYRRLMEFRGALQEALREDDAALGGDMRLRAEMSPAVIRMRSVLPIFENTVYRLRELRRFHRSGVGRTEIGTMSSEEFFRDFAERENILVARLSEVRTMLRMYARLEERSFGGLPSGNSPFDSAADPFGN